MGQDASKPEGVTATTEPLILRDFTLTQLQAFDGTRAENGNKVYIALKRDVFDVSSARDTFYGPGQSYFCFAGREASRCMATMCLDEGTDLAGGMDISDLSPTEVQTLDDWIQKFHAKGYPIVGRVSEPPSNIKFTREQLQAYDGFNESTKIEGRVNLPIYIGFNGKVYDVSYGGVGFYGSKESPYHIFAGKDATRGLSKMSLKPEDANSIDKSDFGENEFKTQTEWEVKFDKKYPIVGEIIEGDTSSK
jgi:membrane-associated progesterone receptor component